MTPRTTLVGIVALLVGVAVLVTADGVMATALGVALLLPGLGVIAAAGLLGLRIEDPGRANEAEQAKQDADTAGLKRASETGRWPRVIGGGQLQASVTRSASISCREALGALRVISSCGHADERVEPSVVAALVGTRSLCC